LLATIKVHSSLRKYFNQPELRADFNTYNDIFHYLHSMHPRFNHYMNMISWGHANESFALLDKNYNLVTNEEFHIRKIHDEDVIYLAPVIIGGGGKRGGLLALIAIGIFAFALAPALAGGAAASGAAAGSAGATAGASSAGGIGSLFKAFGAMPSFARSLFTNIAMSMISKLFTKKKKDVEVDSATRQNGAFGNLTNTIQSGTPIPLIYGQFRVAGQMISGYIESEDHGKNDVVKVRDKF
jgi:predicted phage tail protein